MTYPAPVGKVSVNRFQFLVACLLCKFSLALESLKKGTFSLVERSHLLTLVM